MVPAGARGSLYACMRVNSQGMYTEAHINAHQSNHKKNHKHNNAHILIILCSLFIVSIINDKGYVKNQQKHTTKNTTGGQTQRTHDTHVPSQTKMTSRQMQHTRSADNAITETHTQRGDRQTDRQTDRQIEKKENDLTSTKRYHYLNRCTRLYAADPIY